MSDASRCENDIHFPSGLNVYTPLSSTPMHAPAHTHPLQLPAFPPGGEHGVEERESDWLSWLASSPAACQLAIHSCSAVGVPAA